MFLFSRGAWLLAIMALMACDRAGVVMSSGTPSAFVPASSPIPAEAQRLLAVSPNGFTDPQALELRFGIAGNEPGALVAGISGDPATQAFQLGTLAKGVFLGDGGRSETFTMDDPSLVDNHLAGPASLAPAAGTGLFMARFRAGDRMLLNLRSQENGPFLPWFDEIAMRLAAPRYEVQDGHGGRATLITEPHFVLGSSTLCADSRAGLTANRRTGVFRHLRYLLFVPASRMGRVTACSVNGPATVVSPVSNDYLGSLRTDPCTWKPRDLEDWIGDPGCEGLARAIDGLARTTDRHSRPWVDLAAYFQAYFMKFYKAGCTTFCPAPGHPLGDEAGSPAAFEFIAMEPGNRVSLATGAPAALQIYFDPFASAFTCGPDGVLDVKGRPPLTFFAEVR